MTMLNIAASLFDYRKRKEAERKLAEANATIARLQDLIAKFQRGGKSDLYRKHGNAA